MSDLLSLLGLDSSNNKTQSELLVESYKKTQQPKVDALKTRQKDLEKKQSYFTSLKSKLDALVSQMDKFEASDINTKFDTRKVTLSNSSYFTASADGSAFLGTTSAKVNRVASNDALITKQLNLSENTLFSDLNGDYTFTFTVNGESHDVTVNFAGTETNQEAMTKIVSAINNTDDVNINATFVKDTSTTGRISLTSKQTGGDYKIQFNDSAVLAKLGITSADLTPETTTRKISTTTDAGYQKADFNQLNSEIEIGGIKITRNSNTIEDALTGMKLTLIKPQEATDAAVTVSTDVDADSVSNLIQPLLTAYNDLIKYASSDRSMLRSDSAVNNLKFNLRQVATETVTGLDSGAPSRVTDLGIKVGSDGTLSISDKTKLETIMKDDPQKIADIFTSEDGFISKLNETIANLTGNNSLITSRTLSLSSQINQTKQKTTELVDRIDRQANIMRKQYESMLKIMLEAQSQYSLLGYYSG